MSWVPLHVHSHHSLMAGLPSVEDLAVRAARDRLPALALTDRHTTSGLVRFVEACRARGVRPIPGVELADLDDPSLRLVLLSRNARGLADLHELTTFHLERLRGPRLEDLFARPFPDLWALCLHPDLLQRLAHTPLRPSLWGGLVVHDADSRARAVQVEEVARSYDLPVVATPDIWFLDPLDHDLHCLLAAIAWNTSVDRLGPSQHAPTRAFFPSEEVIRQRFARVPQAVDATLRLADLCFDDLAPRPWILPQVPVPRGHTPDSWLAHLAWQGLDVNYPPGSPARTRAAELQSKELDVVARTGYASYFLMVREIRAFAAAAFGGRFRRERECSILRGSAANCLTFFNIGASDLDPVAHGLYFERFLNEDRTSPPDADLDFGWDERDRALHWFRETYGDDYTCILGTTHHFRSKAAFRETARALGLSQTQVTRVIERERRRPRVPGNAHWLDRLEVDPEFGRVAALAAQVRGRPHLRSQHPGGVIVTNDPVWRHLSCRRTPDGRRVSHMDMHAGIEFLGLVKFDILGNGSLSVLRDTLEQLDEQGEPDPKVWDMERMTSDSRVQDMIRQGRTRGIFYIESPAQMRLNRRAGASTFEDVGVTSSLVRPAGTAWAEEYVRRVREARSGKPPGWEWLHPSLRPILADTFDICVFQEDVTRICVEVAGLPFARADRVRKMMNSLHEGEPADWELVRTEFLAGCARASGLDPAQAESLWKRVASFRGFSFCKSHSLSYAQLSFRCAWLKDRYPAQFLASVASNAHGFYAPSVYMQEARALGITLRAPEVDRARWRSVGKERVIDVGFCHVRGMRREAAEALVAERGAGGRFGGLADLRRRVPLLSRSEAEALALVGAFDRMDSNRTRQMARIGLLWSSSRPPRPDLFGGDPEVPGLPAPDLVRKARHEVEILGFPVSVDLVAELARLPEAARAVPFAELARYDGRMVDVLGMVIAWRSHRVERSGEPMLFLTLQDGTGTLDAVLWPEVCRRFWEVTSGGGGLCLRGRVAVRDDALTLEVTWVGTPRQSATAAPVAHPAAVR